MFPKKNSDSVSPALPTLISSCRLTWKHFTHGVRIHLRDSPCIPFFETTHSAGAILVVRRSIGQEHGGAPGQDGGCPDKELDSRRGWMLARNHHVLQYRGRPRGRGGRGKGGQGGVDKPHTPMHESYIPVTRAGGCWSMPGTAERRGRVNVKPYP